MYRRFTVEEFKSPVLLQGYTDYQRHQVKLNKVLMEGEKNKVVMETLVVREGGKTTRIPLVFLREHGFAFDTEGRIRIGHQDRKPYKMHRTSPVNVSSANFDGKGEPNCRYHQVSEKRF